MQEVSTRACEILWLALERSGEPLERLAEGILDVATLRDPRARIDWDVFCRLLGRFEAMRGPGSLEEAGTALFEDRTMRARRAFAGLFVGLRQVYEHGGRLRNAAYYTNLTRHFEQLADGRFRVEWRIPPEDRGCEAFFRLRIGTLRAAPRYLGYTEDAAVEAEIGSHVGRFVITPPARRPLLNRLRHVRRRLRARRNALQELVAGQEELRQSHAKLGEAFAEIEAQARALRESESRLRDLAENLPQTFWVSSQDLSTVHYSSPAYEALTGEPRERLHEDPFSWLAIVHPDDRADVERELERLRTSAEPREFEHRIQRPGQALRWVKQRWQPVRRDGVMERWVGTAEDLTERKRLEESVREAHKLEAVAKLAGGVAHDFNNLLTVILADASFLLEALPEGAEAREFAEEIREAAARGASLADDLLAFGRQDAPEPRVIDLNELVDRVVRILLRVVPANVEIDVRHSPEAAPVEADPGQLERVLVNLAANARDALEGESGRLTLRLRNVVLSGAEARDLGLDAAGCYVEIAAQDTGRGMDDATRERIFEPFFSTKEVGAGTGLGLAIVYGIVRASRGAIRVDSVPGSGTQVRIWLPHAEGAIEALEPALAAAPVPDGDETVLLVEDESGVRGVLARALRAHGYQVLEAADGLEAVELARDHAGALHAVVTDVVMPRGDGIGVVDGVAALHPETRFLAVSGYTGGERVRSQLAERGVPLLAKPFQPGDLVRGLREILDAP